MLALAAADAVGVVLFGALYAVAGAGLLPQGAFVVCLVSLFVLVSAVWLRTEARHRRLALVRRIVLIGLGLGLAIVATPVLVLMPVFWLDQQLPAEAGLRALRGGIMALVLIALALVVFVNVAGTAVVLVRAALARRNRSRGARRQPPSGTIAV
jgi:hypothetical protein